MARSERMKVIDTKFDIVKILVPDVYEDSRGYFFESYNHHKFEEAIGKTVSFKQDNQSLSQKNVIRGLHYQIAPFSQGKLVRVLHGAILDVVVDIRKNSPTLGQWFSVNISDDNKYQLWIPTGFAHGFAALTDTVEIFYKATDYYHPESERTIKWNDPELNILWGIESPTISTKDGCGIMFDKAEYI